MNSASIRQVTILGLAVLLGQVALASIVDTRHNLSISGPGPIKATSETEVCIFCHTPHNGNSQVPLWNRQESVGTYTMYWSATMDAYPSAAAAPQPNGASKLCLSCHDGTIALGSTLQAATISMSGGITTMPVSSSSFLGQNLTGDHPVSFTVTDSLIATNNAKGDVPLQTLGEMRTHPLIRLDSSDRIQCSTCHNPHDDTYGNFLLTSQVSDLCVACHS